jgi:hypothetical protein
MNEQTLGVGLHYGVKASNYHADPCESPSLSSGLARTILSQSIAHAWHEHPKLGGSKSESTPAMTTGSVVHALLAGEDSDLEVGTYDNYRSKAAQDWRDGVIASGKTPALERDLDTGRLIVASVKEKAALGITNTPFADHGRSEVTAIWKEGETFCRARYDRLVIDPNGYADIWDYKTTTDVSPDAIQRSIIDHGYHIQAAFYLRGLSTILPAYAGRTSFVFVFVETSAPYAVRRVCLGESFMTAGAHLAGVAINEWRNAIASNQFNDPLSGQTITMPAPDWYLRKLEEDKL